MTSQRIVWAVKGREIQPSDDKVYSLGLNVIYPNRECDIHIFPALPLRGETPENEVALNELRLLRDALNHILDAQKP